MSQWFTRLAAVIFLAALPCEAQPIAEPIINGHPSTVSPPWMVSLQWDGQHICGGVLVNPNYVLTAGHCGDAVRFIPNISDRVAVVIGGTHLLSNEGTRVPVAGVIMHPRWDSYLLTNDVALLKLAHPVSIDPITVARPEETNLIQGGSAVTLLGWGQATVFDSVYPDALQEAVIPVLSDAACLNLDGTYFISSSMMCAGTLSSPGGSDGVDSCYGDSGGPLVSYADAGIPKVVGLVSFGLGLCASDKTLGIYAKVPAVYDFVMSTPDITPYPIVAPAIVGDAEVGHRLICNPGTWAGDPATQMQIQWVRDVSGIVGEIEIVIPGATGRSYRVQEADKDRAIICRVTQSNSGGQNSADSQSTSISEDLSASGDSKGEAMRFESLTCTGTQCTVTVIALDDQDFKHVFGYIGTRNGGKLVKSKKIEASTVDGETWSFTLRRPRRLPASFYFFGVNFDDKHSKLGHVPFTRKGG